MVMRLSSSFVTSRIMATRSSGVNKPGLLVLVVGDRDDSRDRNGQGSLG
jgi:hypothetical protein